MKAKLKKFTHDVHLKTQKISSLIRQSNPAVSCTLARICDAPPAALFVGRSHFLCHRDREHQSMNEREGGKLKFVLKIFIITLI